MKRNKHEIEPVTSQQEIAEAQAARQRSEARLQEVQNNWSEVKSISASLRALRTENHFAERYRKAHS